MLKESVSLLMQDLTELLPPMVGFCWAWRLRSLAGSLSDCHEQSPLLAHRGHVALVRNQPPLF